MSQPIPQPPPSLFLGNLRDIDPQDAIGSITQLIRRYGEIVKLQVPNGPKNGRLFIGSQRLVHEVADQGRFEKIVTGALQEVRSVAGDGKSRVAAAAAIDLRVLIDDDVQAFSRRITRRIRGIYVDDREPPWNAGLIRRPTFQDHCTSYPHPGIWTVEYPQHVSRDGRHRYPARRKGETLHGTDRSWLVLMADLVVESIRQCQD